MSYKSCELRHKSVCIALKLSSFNTEHELDIVTLNLFIKYTNSERGRERERDCCKTTRFMLIKWAKDISSNTRVTV